MLENWEGFEKCEFCFSLMAYMIGHCPVCNDTGLVKKEAKEPSLFEDKDYVNPNREFNNPVDAIR